MPDREKAIRILEGNYKNFVLRHNGELLTVNELIALLKAQEPMEPVPGLWDRDIQLFICGACGGEIGAGGIAKYCSHCGRTVKWE